MDCYKVWELLTSEKLKTSQLEGDGRSIISKIIKLKNKQKLNLIMCVCVKTEKNKYNTIDNEVVEMLLKCGKKVKEERIQSDKENRLEMHLQQ